MPSPKKPKQHLLPKLTVGKLSDLSKGRLALSVLVGFVVAATTFYSVAAARRMQPHTLVPVAIKPVILATPATPTPTTTKTTPPPTPAPAPQPAAKTPTAVASSSTPVPVVTPSPASSVSSLDPTPPPSGGSGGSSGGSSGGTSGQTTTTGYTSTNWSGYLSTSGSFTAVSASWIVPTTTGNGSSTSYDGTWVGIGGVTSGDLIQVGTADFVSPSGQQSASAFYELLPSFSQTIPTVSVSAGDSITASVSEISSGQWTISLTDNTTGKSYTNNVTYASSHSSAEWIEEDPSSSRNHLLPLANFGTVSFSGGSTLENGNSVNIAGSSAVPVTLVDGSSQTIGLPSAIGGGGASFSVTHK